MSCLEPLGGSWDLVSKVISTLIGVISIVALIITLVTKSHDPLSMRDLRVPRLRSKVAPKKEHLRFRVYLNLTKPTFL